VAILLALYLHIIALYTTAACRGLSIFDPIGENMKALTWHGKSDIRCESVPDPQIQHGQDAIIKVTACAICGSDLHIFDGVIPSMEKAWREHLCGGLLKFNGRLCLRRQGCATTA
jgi:hypothetical protein